MATTTEFRNTKTNMRAIPQNGYRDMTVAAVGSASNINCDITGVTERFFISSAVVIRYWSERVDAQVTISGPISFSIRATTSHAGFTGRLRATLYKITASGDVETLIGQADAAADLVPVVSTTYVFGFTPVVPLTLAPNERFICLMSVLPVAGSFGTGFATLQTNSGATLTGKITFTETIAFKTNGATLFLRSSDSGIGNFFDMLETRTAGAVQTGLVNTTASGTEIQWTRGAMSATNVAAAIASTTNASTYASASFTPVANRLYLLSVTHSDAAPEATVPTVTTTTGLVFVQVATVVFDTIASNVQRLTLFRAMKASGLSAGTFTVTLADAGTGCCAHLTELPNLLTTGTDGADAIRNVSTNNANATANPNVTLGAFDNAANGTYACFGSDIATAPTAGTGFTTLLHNTYATPTAGLYTEFQAANDTTATCTLASSDWAGIAVELVADAASMGLLEWISPRVKAPGWTVSAIEYFGTHVIYYLESNVAANCTSRIKIFRRTPAGVETLVATWSSTTEFATGLGGWAHVNSWGTLNQATSFAEDDRLVFRAYIIPAPTLTMGGGYTCTLSFDQLTPGSQSDCTVMFVDGPDFKASGDPDADPEFIPDGLSMGGIGN